MANVVLIHSVYGLRPAVAETARLLRDAGHSVHTPDLYDGETTDTVDAGRAIRDRIGIPVLLKRASTATAEMAPGTIYAGFSMGAAIAEHCAGNDAGAGGLLLLHSVGDASAQTQPTCPAQAHVAADDPFWSRDECDAWAAAYGDAAEVFTYAGGGHLYTDAGLPDFHQESANLTWQRVLAFLAR